MSQRDTSPSNIIYSQSTGSAFRDWCFGFAVCVVLSTATIIFAQSGGGYDLAWSTIDGGGAMSSSGGTYVLVGTIGQPDPQMLPIMSGGSFEITGGFWPVSSVCYCPGDTNGDGYKDGNDIRQFVNCLLAGDNCSCADVDQINGATINDVAVFVNNLLLGPNCP